MTAQTAADPLFDVSGRSIAVMGAGGAIGARLCAMLTERGARLTLGDSDAARLSDAARAAPPGAPVLRCDITRRDDCDQLATAAVAAYGRLDAAINAAGLLPIAAAETVTRDAFQSCMDANMTGALLFSQAAAQAMAAQDAPTGGVILHIASVSSLVANVHYVSYAASKAALAQMVRVLGREWAPRGVRINALGPALIETPLTEAYLSDPKFRAQAIAAIPMGRLCQTEDLIGPALLLLSGGGAFITGQTLYVDGGRTLT